MVSRRLVFVTSIVATAISSFTLGVIQTRRADAATDQTFDAQIASLRAEMRSQLGRTPKTESVSTAGTAGRITPAKDDVAVPTLNARAKMVAEIKQELQTE